tara:strand:+ start:5486 stop:5788 length:303 start_codon:yes stop_codon:yes gene_type:complete
MQMNENVQWESLNHKDGPYEMWKPASTYIFRGKRVAAFFRENATLNDRPLFDLHAQVYEISGLTLYTIAVNQREFQCLKIINSMQKGESNVTSIPRVNVA